MATRAVYTFKSHGEAFHVYKHWDNAPTGAAAFIRAALQRAWDLPRFEADEFAAAFIAENKHQAGDIRLIKSPSRIADADFFYEVEHDGKDLIVTCKDWDKRRRFKGTLARFDAWVASWAEGETV
jgi:hypothetical protein